MNLLHRTTSLVVLGILTTALGVLNVASSQAIAIQAQSQPTSDTIPTKTASLDQRGIDKVLNQLKENPDQAAKVAEGLKNNPRETITKLFRLSSVQAENLKSLSDAELAEYVNPVTKALSGESLAKTQIAYGTTSEPNGDGTSAKKKTTITVTVE